MPTPSNFSAQGPKNASGYRVEEVLDGDVVNLHKIVIGAEGTLGLVTEAKLNLVPLPGRRAIAMVYFPNVFSAGETVFPILGLKPTSLEIMDGGFLRFVRRNDPQINAMVPADADSALLVEFEAADDGQLSEQLDSSTVPAGRSDVMAIRPARGPSGSRRSCGRSVRRGAPAEQAGRAQAHRRVHRGLQRWHPDVPPRTT